VIFGGAEQAGALTATVPIRCLGQVDDDRRLAALYSAADVMVVPSRQDNLPQTGLEAQACGTPVVAFRSHGLPDIVEHGITGFLAVPFSVESLESGIRWCLEAERTAELAAAARKRAVACCSPNVIAAAYRRVYHAAIAGQR
jgi:glycosyltransferase involved in cell wall biosynthesis